MASSDETAVEADKSKSLGVAANGRSQKKPAKSAKLSPKAAWGKLLSQSSQVCLKLGFFKLSFES